MHACSTICPFGFAERIFCDLFILFLSSAIRSSLNSEIDTWHWAFIVASLVGSVARIWDVAWWVVASICSVTWSWALVIIRAWAWACAIIIRIWRWRTQLLAAINTGFTFVCGHRLFGVVTSQGKIHWVLLAWWIQIFTYLGCEVNMTCFDGSL